MKAEAAQSIIIRGKEVKITPKLIERFWSRVDKESSPSGCWNWIGCKSPRGYGRFGIGKKMERANRISLALVVGSLKDDWHACHKCDNPSCVNPDHLWLGSPAENMQDMIKKGRRSNISPKGECHGFSRLTENDAREIRERYIPWKFSRGTLAKIYGVSRGTIQAVLEGRTWRHVQQEAPQD